MNFLKPLSKNLLLILIVGSLVIPAPQAYAPPSKKNCVRALALVSVLGVFGYWLTSGEGTSPPPPPAPKLNFVYPSTTKTSAEAATVGSPIEAGPLFTKEVMRADFVLTTSEGKTPSTVIFSKGEQKAFAESINLWRGTPGDTEKGVVVEFEGMYFYRDPFQSDHLRVRIVGYQYELELKESIPIEAFENGEEFDKEISGEKSAAVVTGETLSRVVFRYDPSTRKIKISKISGSLKWSMVTFGGMQEEEDSGSFENVTGTQGQLSSKPLLEF